MRSSLFTLGLCCQAHPLSVPCVRALCSDHDRCCAPHSSDIALSRGSLLIDLLCPVDYVAFAATRALMTSSQVCLFCVPFISHILSLTSSPSPVHAPPLPGLPKGALQLVSGSVILALWLRLDVGLIVAIRGVGEPGGPTLASLQSPVLNTLACSRKLQNYKESPRNQSSSLRSIWIMT